MRPSTEHVIASAQEPSVGPLWRRRLDQAGFFLLLAVIVLCPLPDGSVGLFWVIIWAAVVSLAVLLMDFSGVTRAVSRMIGGLVLVLAAYGAVAVLQSMSPGPAPLPIWLEAAALADIDLAPIAASVRDAPFVFLGRPLLAVLVLVAAMVAAQDRRRAALILWSVIISACLYGIVGWLALRFGWRALKFNEEGYALTAFFISKNTTSTYLGSALLVAFAFLVTPIRLSSSRSLQSILGRVQRRELLPAVLGGGVLLVLLPLTNSRAGLAFTLGLMLATIAVVLRRSRGLRLPLAVILLGLFALVFVVTGEVWRARLAQFGVEGGGRLLAYQLMLGSILEHPWLGTGLGSFASAFPPLRIVDLGTLRLWNIGHSTPLELAFEAGIPMFVVVSAGVLTGGWVLGNGIIKRPHDPVVLAGLLVGLLGILHSSIDFSLQLPGYLIVWCAIVGAGLGRSVLGSYRRRRRHRSKSSGDAPQASRAEEPNEDQGAQVPGDRSTAGGVAMLAQG